MINSYCQGCGQSTPQNMRICPQCGGRKFATTQPTLNSLPQDGGLTASPMTAPINSPSSGTTLLVKNTPAGHLPRLFAAIIDSVLSQGAVYIIILISALVFVPKTPAAAFGTTFIISMITATLYYAIQHSSVTQATIGKRLMGLKLVTLSGDPVSFGLSVWRVLLPSLIFVAGTAIFGVAAVPIIMLADNAPSIQTTIIQSSATSAFLLVFILMIFVPLLLVFGNPARKTLYDFICKTRVVQV